MKRNTAFTVMELLAVMAIIVIIIGIGVPAYNSWRHRARITSARATIAKIEMALEMYKSDNGVYPNYNGDLNTAGAGNLRISQCLAQYISFKSSELDNSEQFVNDPWNVAYRVFVDHDGDATTPSGQGFDHNRSSCYINSHGPDGPSGNSSDDIDNYRQM